MTTVMSWGDSEGEQGRCDAKCHEARDLVCTCMCGGLLHGKGLEPGGLERALAELGDEVLAGAKARAGEAGMELKAASVASILQQVHLDGAQGELFVRDGIFLRSRR
ncbi:MAG: hypothetical protein QM765_14850 [Myxococcales bacterium]